MVSGARAGRRKREEGKGASCVDYFKTEMWNLECIFLTRACDDEVVHVQYYSGRPVQCERPINFYTKRHSCSPWYVPVLVGLPREYPVAPIPRLRGRYSTSPTASLHSWVFKQFPLSPDMEKSLHQFQEWIQKQPVEQLWVTAACLLITLIILVLSRFIRRSKSNTIIIAGLSGGGKTVLFYQLRDGSPHLGTVTSMEPNDGTFALHSELDKKGKVNPVRLVDVPGHLRLRPKLDEHLPHAAGIIFVVDGLDFLQNYRAAAEYLYDILTRAIIVKRKIPVLIVCNKADKVTAHSKEFIRKQLEKEIDKLRSSRTGMSTADVTTESTLGVPDEAFTFAHCRNKVTVVEASGLNGDVSNVEQFIRENVH